MTCNPHCYYLFSDFQVLCYEIYSDYSHEPINSLCYFDDSLKINYKKFEVAKPLYGSFLQNYQIMSPSQLFKNIWSTALKKASKAGVEITFADVVVMIWDPVLNQCHELVESVRKKTIKLSDVDEYFYQYHVEGSILQQIKNLYKATETCHGRTEIDSSWISDSVECMKQYWIICEQAKAAIIVLKLKDRFNLTGDFKIIQNVASKVAESMKDESLDKINHEFIEVTSFLEQVTEEGKENLECLQTFLDCQNIVNWIRTETTGKSLICFFFTIRVCTLMYTCIN